MKLNRASLFMSFADKLIVFYGTCLPHHKGKWRVIERLVKILRMDKFHSDQSFVVKRQGILWRLFPQCLVQRSLYYSSYYEINETRQLKRLIEPNWVFFDIGAYFGYYSLLVYKMTNGQADIYAFEPLSSNYKLLSYNKHLNNYVKLKTLKLAVSDKVGEIEFTCPPVSNQGHARITVPGNRVATSRSTEMLGSTTLDHFVKQNGINRIDFIKMDVEGAEGLCLNGGKETIGALKPILMIEVNPEGLLNYGSSAETLFGSIKRLGYKTYTVKRSGLRHCEELPAKEGYYNLFCFPEVHRMGRYRQPVLPMHGTVPVRSGSRD